MSRKLKAVADSAERFCKAEIDRMLKNSQTKVIMPVIALGILRDYSETGKALFSDSQIRNAYQSSIKDLKKFLGHDVHIPELLRMTKALTCQPTLGSFIKLRDSEYTRSQKPTVSTPNSSSTLTASGCKTATLS